ncbi:hypothetical protein SLEP1_g31353 [Rubroshorea leprosula]|uniref:Reverse transcriptase zinc-binding domain-containing protein n=1 Tax=Rubroshorea leprosula TaxID=152421 RepID=A0AAV5K345_9ROSI|nr:hypothetical protein SLEP1_g31353 [Rubroshorea leprosula]
MLNQIEIQMVVGGLHGEDRCQVELLINCSSWKIYILEEVQRPNGFPDQIKWQYSTVGYSPKRAYSFLEVSSPCLDSNSCKLIRTRCCPLEVSVFAWRLMLNRDNLAARGIDLSQQDSCIFCDMLAKKMLTMFLLPAVKSLKSNNEFLDGGTLRSSTQVQPLNSCCILPLGLDLDSLATVGLRLFLQQLGPYGLQEIIVFNHST